MGAGLPSTRSGIDVFFLLLVGFGVFISADLLVLALALLHKLPQNCIILLGDSLGCHLHSTGAAILLDGLGDSLNSILKSFDTSGLVQTLTS